MSRPTLEAPETLNAPAYDADVIDLSATDWTFTAGKVPRGMNVQVAGLVKVDMWGLTQGTAGTTGITLYLPQGTSGLIFKKVYKTGTTATGLSAVY